MGHSLHKVYVNVVINTKYKYPYFKGDMKLKVIEKINEIFTENNCPVLAINGYYEHVHILFIHNSNISLMTLMKYLKGKSAYYLNNQLDEKSKFGWSVGYGAFSVCLEHLDVKINYINNQEIHHGE